MNRVFLPPPPDSCPVTVDNTITGERWEITIPKSRGDAIESLLFAGHQSDDFAAEMDAPLQSCIYIFKDGPILMRHYTEGDVDQARIAMRKLIDQGTVPGRVGP